MCFLDGLYRVGVRGGCDLCCCYIGGDWVCLVLGVFGREKFIVFFYFVIKEVLVIGNLGRFFIVNIYIM